MSKQSRGYTPNNYNAYFWPNPIHMAWAETVLKHKKQELQETHKIHAKIYLRTRPQIH